MFEGSSPAVVNTYDGQKTIVQMFTVQITRKNIILNWAWELFYAIFHKGSSEVVELMPHQPKVEGSSPAVVAVTSNLVANAYDAQNTIA